MKRATNRYVTLDMRGALRCDVQRAVADGHFAAEMQAAKLLAAMLRRRKDVQNETPVSAETGNLESKTVPVVDSDDPPEPAP